jgi:hypothetical protein
MRLTTSSCKNKFVENLPREKNAKEAKAPWAVVPLMMMMMIMLFSEIITVFTKNHKNCPATRHAQAKAEWRCSSYLFFTSALD